MALVASLALATSSSSLASIETSFVLSVALLLYIRYKSGLLVQAMLIVRQVLHSPIAKENPAIRVPELFSSFKNYDKTIFKWLQMTGFMHLPPYFCPEKSMEK